MSPSALLAVAVVSASILAYQVLLVRLFSITGWHHFAYMIISIALLGFGAAALAMSLVRYSASRLKAVFFADNMALNALFFFAGKWMFNALYLLMERRYGGGELIMQVLVWSSLSAAVTAFAGLATLVVLRPILRTSLT